MKSERGQALILALGVLVAMTMMVTITLEQDLSWMLFVQGREKALEHRVEHCHDTGPCTVEIVP